MNSLPTVGTSSTRFTEGFSVSVSPVVFSRVSEVVRWCVFKSTGGSKPYLRFL